MKKNKTQTKFEKILFQSILKSLSIILIGSIFLVRSQVAYGFSLKSWIGDLFQRSDKVSVTVNQNSNTSWVKDFIAKHPDYKEKDIVLRSENSVHFKRPDGKIVAQIAGSSINYKNDQGQWDTLDTAITSSSDSSYDYQNVTNNFKTYFSSNAYQDKGNIKLVKDDATLTIKILDKLTITGTNGSETLTLSDLAPKTGGERLAKKGVVNQLEQNKFCYPKFYEKEDKTIDVCYVVRESRIQEQLILNKYQGYPELTQTITLKNAYAKRDGKQITFYHTKTNEVLWYILDPVIYEQNEREDPEIKKQNNYENHDLHYDLVCNQTNTQLNNCSDLNITKVLEPKAKEYLSDSQRQYPVVIDPDFTESTNDAHITGSNATFATARSTSSSVDTTNTNLSNGMSLGYAINRSYFKFDTSSIGSGGTVTQVNLKLALVSGGDGSQTDYDLQIVDQNWSAQDPLAVGNMEAAYDNCLAGTADASIWRNTAGIADQTVYASGNLNTAWINKTGSTYYCVRSSRDFAGNTPTGSEYVVLASQNHGTVGLRPILTIVYTAGATPTPSSTPAPTVTPTPGLIIESETGDGYIYGQNATYGTARSTAVSYDTTSNTTMQIGQNTGYSIYRTFLKFNTSTIPDDKDVTQVNLTGILSGEGSNTDFDVQIVKLDWSAQDPIGAGNMEAAYDSCLAGTADNSIWRNTAGESIQTPYTSGNLDTSWVNKTGYTYYCLRSSRDVSATAPSIGEFIYWYPKEAVTSSYHPKLNVLYDTPIGTPTPSPTVTPTPTPTPQVDYESDAGDGYIYGQNATYTIARSTSIAFDNSSSTTMKMGQTSSGPSVYRTFLKFDTSAIPDTDIITQVNLSGTISEEASNPEFDVQIVKLDWSAQDPLSVNREAAYDNCLAGTADNSIWKNTTGDSVNVTYTSGNLDTSWVNKTGFTYYCLRSSRDVSSTVPGNAEYIGWYPKENATASYRPKLTVLHVPAPTPTVTPAPTAAPSQTGWSGQNTQANTAYTSGTQAIYTVQTELDVNTTYYWRSYAIDPGGSNTWSTTQATPYSFTTLGGGTCSGVKKSGNYTVTQACSFPGTVNGVDLGTGVTNSAVLTVDTGGSVTILNGQTVSAGSIILNGTGTMTIVGTGQIKIRTPIWLIDHDNDGYPASTTQVTQTTQPTDGKRRNAFISATAVDPDDNNDLIYPGSTVQATPTPTTPIPPTATPTPITVALGDSIWGGKVAYILQSGDPGYDANRQHGLIAATTDQSSGAWGCNGTAIGGTSQLLGTGNANTTAVMAGCAEAGIATRLARAYAGGGYNDWYLPSYNELQKLCTNKVIIGNFASNYYWSSSEWNASYGYDVNFTGCTTVGLSKLGVALVRPVRSF